MTGSAEEPPGRWLTLAFLAGGLLLAMGPWFSASAVAPLLRDEWHASGLGLTLLTVAVQVGFALGALVLAVSGAADVLPAPLMFVAGAWTAAAATAAFALLARDALSGILIRLVTGAALAAVYPPALKIVAGWFRRDRGFAIGVVIGALTIGSALPHLLRAIGALASAVGGAIVGLAVRSGPLENRPSRFSWRLAETAFREPSVRLANLGYLGHMWELYAMWTWLPAFVGASERARGAAEDRIGAVAALVTFVAVGVGALGCWAGGALADRYGRTRVTSAAMALSGTCALAAGLVFAGPLHVLVALLVVWGIAIVADSAQFSAAVSELAPRDLVGTALTLQTSLGFLLTALTIYLLPAVAARIGWRWSMSVLAIGPALGVWAMTALRRRPEAAALAGGRR